MPKPLAAIAVSAETMYEMSPRSNPEKRRSSHTRTEIARAALAIADSEGFDAVSMRRVASQLGAGTMTLYHYVRNKDELITLMVDEAMGELLVPDVELADDWRTALTQIAIRARAAFAAHRWTLNRLLDGFEAELNLDSSLGLVPTGGRTRTAVELSRGMRGKPQHRGKVDPGPRLAALAKRQHGVVSIRQLRGLLCYSQDAVERLAVAGHLHRLYRGVYAVGHTDISLHGECLAAVLTCGPNALLSHYSAAWLWSLTPTKPIPIHVTSPSPRSRRPPIRLHRASTLTDSDRALHEGIPVTSVARTLLDQAALLDRRRLKRLLERCEENGLFDLAVAHDVLQRNKGHRGHKHLERAIAIYEPPAFTRSDAEGLLLSLFADAGLPRPATGWNEAGHELDFYWPDLRFAVELDFFETHGTREAFERDPLRDEDLALAGIETRRITGRRLEREPAQVIARISALLERRRASMP